MVELATSRFFRVFSPASNFAASVNKTNNFVFFVVVIMCVYVVCVVFFLYYFDLGSILTYSPPSYVPFLLKLHSNGTRVSN